MTVPEIVLASNSPRRKQILTWTGLPFTTTSANIDETPLPGEDAEDYVLRLANEKAGVCARFTPFGGLLVAADTTVSDLDEILGKPEDEDDTRRMLKQLRGRAHFVHTALVISTPSMGRKTTSICTTRVKMRGYTDEEIEAYITSGDAGDKAGAYAIQHEQFHPVEKISGCFANVMGFPLCHFERSLRKMGFGGREEVPYRCQDELSYTCPIFKRVLSGEDVG